MMSCKLHDAIKGEVSDFVIQVHRLRSVTEGAGGVKKSPNLRDVIVEPSLTSNNFETFCCKD